MKHQGYGTHLKIMAFLPKEEGGRKLVGMRGRERE